MNHLNDGQLSSLADGVLAGGARAAAERHLASCARCREALAGLVAVDRDLRGALEHDPGDAYFEDFAARVSGRIRAAGLGGAQARVAGASGLADWFRAPRKLAVVGAVATVVVGAGIVMLSTREIHLPALRRPAVELGTRPAAPPIGTPVSPPAQPTLAAEDEAQATTPQPAPRATAPRVEPRRVDGLAAAPPAAEPRPLAREAAPGAATTSEERVVAAPVTQAEVPVASPAAAANEAGRAKGAGALSTLQKTRPSLGVAKEESAADAFAGQPTFTSLHGRNAERLTALAEKMRVAPAWDSAAAEWAMVLLGTEGTPLEAGARYELARARYRAWQAGATPKRAAKAGEAFAEFLASAPAGSPRDSVTAWQAALGK